MDKLKTMEELGGSYGYIYYQHEDVNIDPGTKLRISGKVNDFVYVLLDGKLLTSPIHSAQEMYKPGYPHSE